MNNQMGLANAFVFIVDLTKRKSLQEIDSVIDHVFEHSKLQRKGQMASVLVGNKCDLIKNRQINLEEIQKKAAELNFSYFETSASQLTNVNEMFHQVAFKAIKSIIWRRQWKDGKRSNCIAM